MRRYLNSPRERIVLTLFEEDECSRVNDMVNLLPHRLSSALKFEYDSWEEFGKPLERGNITSNAHKKRVTRAKQLLKELV